MLITNSTFAIIAMKSYDNQSCKTILEYHKDVLKFNGLARLCSKDNVDTHILLNLIMSLLNIFELSACVRLMFFKVNELYWYKLKTILIFLNRMPESIPEIPHNKLEEIKLCQYMIDTLRKI